VARGGVGRKQLETMTKISVALLPLDSIPYQEGVGRMKEGKYYRANIKHSHDLVKAKVLVLLRQRDSWMTVDELWQACRFKSDATLRSHCGLWSHRYSDKKGISHENLLVRQARGRAGTTRTKWEYHISRRGIRWLQWNVDQAGLLEQIMDEIDFEPNCENKELTNEEKILKLKQFIETYLPGRYKFVGNINQTPNKDGSHDNFKD
jgi:hypothetical protein